MRVPPEPAGRSHRIHGRSQRVYTSEVRKSDDVWTQRIIEAESRLGRPLLPHELWGVAHIIDALLTVSPVDEEFAAALSRSAPRGE